MDLFFSQTGAQIIFILGVINLIMAILIIFTCRCIPMWKLTKSIVKFKSYQVLIKYHCYFWYIFWPSVVLHIIFTLSRLGIPF